MLPPSTKASAASRLTVRLRLAVDAASRTIFAACKVEPCTLVVLVLPVSTWPEAEAEGVMAVNVANVPVVIELAKLRARAVPAVASAALAASLNVLAPVLMT